MNQHPIPQNILDIEFKLFSHFTIKEFAYLAIGAGFGVIFLYLMSSGKVAPIVAIPIFILSAGAGAFLGLVPINDQKADVYLKNFIRSVSTPTLRVWKSDYVERNIFQSQNATSALVDAKNEKASTKKTNIIGATNISAKQKDPSEDAIDIEESKRKIEINKIISSTGAGIRQQSPKSNLPDNKIAPASTKENSQAESAPRTTAQDIKANVQPNTQTETIQNRVKRVISVKKIKVPDEILINNSNVEKFKATFSLLSPPPNSINISIRDTKNYGVAKAVVLIKDNSDKILQVKVSDAKGEIITERQYEPGVYKIEVQHTNFVFPKIVYAFNAGTDIPIKIIGVHRDEAIN